MHKTVKLYADNGDIKGLKYIFVDCLDADPTFEDYREDFKYCQDLPGLIEEHVELTPFCEDLSGWNENYWIGLKKDLLKNFSLQRFQHMQRVAKVIYKEKVRKIQDERQACYDQENEKNQSSVSEPWYNVSNNIMDSADKSQQNISSDSVGSASKSDQEKREMEEAKRQLAFENQQTERIRRQEELLRNKERKDEENRNNSSNDTGKKVLGAVLAVLLILLVLVIILGITD